MTEADFEKILNACQPVLCMMIGGYAPRSPQENANAAWDELGSRMGFDGSTVYPDASRGKLAFTAVPNETQEQKEAREDREAKDKADLRRAALKSQLEKVQAELASLGE